METIDEQAAKGFFDFKLAIEDDYPEADGESVVTRLAPEEGSDGVESIFVKFLDGRCVWRDMRASSFPCRIVSFDPWSPRQRRWSRRVIRHGRNAEALRAVN